MQELLFGDLTRGTNVIGLFQLFIDRSKRLIIFLVQPLQRFKEEFVFFYFIIFFAGNLLIAIYLECNYEFSVIKYQDLLQKGCGISRAIFNGINDRTQE